MKEYIVKPPIVKAEKWNPAIDNDYVLNTPGKLLMAGASPVLHMEMFHKIRSASGQLGAYYIDTGERILWGYVEPNDWVVVDGSNRVSTYTNDNDFNELYELKEKENGKDKQKILDSMDYCFTIQEI